MDEPFECCRGEPSLEDLLADEVMTPVLRSAGLEAREFREMMVETARRIELRVFIDNDQAILEVADQGPGISEADRQSVLDRFVRLEPSRTTPGNGLGLSLVRAIARRHDGSVTLEDNAPGLRVRLKFPRLRM